MNRLFLLMVFAAFALPANTQTISELTGVNARAKDEHLNDWEKMRRFESVREYHDWSIDVGYPGSNVAAPPPATDKVQPHQRRSRRFAPL